jgi:hypothetical protein
MVLKIRLNMALVAYGYGYGYGPYSNGYTDEEKPRHFMMQSRKLQTKGKKNNSRILN